MFPAQPHHRILCPPKILAENSLDRSVPFVCLILIFFILYHSSYSLSRTDEEGDEPALSVTGTDGSAQPPPISINKRYLLHKPLRHNYLLQRLSTCSMYRRQVRTADGIVRCCASYGRMDCRGYVLALPLSVRLSLSCSSSYTIIFGSTPA